MMNELPTVDFFLLSYSTITIVTAWTSAVSATQVSSLLTPCQEAEPQVRTIKFEPTDRVCSCRACVRPQVFM